MAKYIVILGSGESGVGAAILAKKQGFQTFVSDNNAIKLEYKTQLLSHQIDFEEQHHSEEKILKADEVVKSPGIPEKSALIKKIREKNIPIISEIEFASRFTKGEMIAITGSNGKSTTTALTYHLLQKAGFNVSMVGNIGKSFALQVAEKDTEYYVIEVSSFQLDDIISFKPKVSILLNITPDHLDRYDYKFENYVHSKFRIIENQDEKDFFIYCEDDDGIMNHIQHYQTKAQKLSFSISKKIEEGACVTDEKLFFNHNQKSMSMSIYELALQGKHNWYNSMAAGIVGRIFDLRKEAIRDSLNDFKNLEHRLEFVARIHGVEFINDSKATNVNSVWYALESMTQPVVWIAGGVDKGNDYSIIEPLIKQKVKAIVCMGIDNRRIHEAFGKTVDIIVNTSSAEEAVKMSYHFSKPGDVVLLSPACSSFDLFQNYEDRGRQFKKYVRAL